MADWISSTLSFGDAVEDLVGVSISKDDALSQYLTNGAREVVSRVVAMRPEKAMQFADNRVTAANTGMSVADVSTDILSVTLGLGTTLWEDVKPSTGEDATAYEWGSVSYDWVSTNYPCDRIDHNEANEAYNINSLKYRTLYNAGWFMRNGKILTTPTPGGGTSMNVTFVEYPIVQHSFTPETLTVYQDGEETTKGLEKFPVQYSHLVSLYAATRVLRNLISLKTIPAFDADVPTTPAVPTISYSAASLGDSFGGLAQDSIDEAQDSIATVVFDYTGETDTAADGSVTAGTSTHGSATPGGATADTSANGATAAGSTASAYSSPTVSGDGTELTGVSGLEAENTIDAHATVAEFDQWWAALAHFIEDEEDSELAQLQLGKINSYITAFQAEVADASAAMQATIQDAQLATQASISTAGNENQAEIAKMQGITQASIAAGQQTTQANIATAQGETQSNIADGQQTTQANIATHQTDATIKQAGMGSLTSAKTAKMQAATNAAIAKMNASTGAATAKMNQSTTAAIQKMTQSTNLNVVNAAKTLEAAMGDYQMEIARFTGDIQRYGGEAQQYGQIINKANMEYQWLVEQYTSVRREYDAAFAALVTPEQSVKTAMMDEQKVAQARPSAKVI
tara:strand:- start:1088 stop:2974 length:1887 start_codon:yes stop_codon:yes gene_type:complete